MTKSKSAYSLPTKLSKLETHIIVVWVDNEASVLSRVVGLFSGRGYRLFVSLSIGKSNVASRSRFSSVSDSTIALSLPL